MTYNTTKHQLAKFELLYNTRAPRSRTKEPKQELQALSRLLSEKAVYQQLIYCYTNKKEKHLYSHLINQLTVTISLTSIYFFLQPDSSEFNIFTYGCFFILSICLFGCSTLGWLTLTTSKSRSQRQKLLKANTSTTPGCRGKKKKRLFTNRSTIP